MKTHIIFFSFITIILISASCNHVSLSGDIGDKFYSYLQEDNYDAIIKLFDDEAFKKHSKEEWKELLSSRNKYFGKLESYKAVGFHTDTKENYQIIQLDYKVNNTYGQVFEEIKLIHKDKQIKILNYRFSADIVLVKK